MAFQLSKKNQINLSEKKFMKKFSLNIDLIINEWLDTKYFNYCDGKSITLSFFKKNK